MRINRRDFMRGLAGGLLAVGAFPGKSWAERCASFASCGLDAEGEFVRSREAWPLL